MRIRVTAPTTRSPVGYGEFSRAVIWALHHAGHELSVNTQHFSAPTEPLERFGMKGLLVGELWGAHLSGVDVALTIATPQIFPKFTVPGAVNLGFSMYEAMRAPASYVHGCNTAEIDAVLVPSSLDKEIFGACGVTPPIAVVPPPLVLPPEFAGELPRREKDPFVFYTAHEWATPHKDPKALFSAYYQEFRADEPVLLRLKTFERGPPDTIAAQIRHLKAILALDRPYAATELVLGSLTTDEMWASYTQANAIVSSHRGEGWGLPLFEGMGMGLPAIATGWGGNMDFMSDTNSYPVAYAIGPDDSGAIRAAVHVADLRRKMRHVFENQEEARARGMKARAELLARFTPEATAAKIERVVRSVMGGVTTAKTSNATTRHHPRASVGFPGMATGVGARDVFDN